MWVYRSYLCAKKLVFNIHYCLACMHYANRAHDDRIYCIQLSRVLGLAFSPSAWATSKGILHITSESKYIWTWISNNPQSCMQDSFARARTRPKAARPSARATIGYLVYNPQSPMLPWQVSGDVTWHHSSLYKLVVQIHHHYARYSIVVACAQRYLAYKFIIAWSGCTSDVLLWGPH